MNKSEYEANRFLAQSTKRYNSSISKKENTIPGFAGFVAVFWAIGFLLSVAYFA